MGSLEHAHAPSAEPPGGLAHQKTLDAKLGAAAKTTHRRNAKRAATPAAAPIADVVDDVVDTSPSMTDRVRSLLEDPSFVVRRITEDEADPISIEAVATRLEIFVPKRFRGATFENFQPASDSQRSAVKLIRRWCADAARGDGPMLALVGDQGCGKSHLLYAAMRSLTENGHDAYAWPWYKLADELRYGGASPFQADTVDEPQQVRARLWKQRFVLIDEVRTTASTDFDNTELAKFAGHAYDDKIAVLITTNVNPIGRVMGAPAASRFTQLLVEGPDYRHMPLENAHG